MDNTNQQFQAYIAPDDKLKMRNAHGHWESFMLEKKLQQSRMYITWTNQPADEPSMLDTPTDVLHYSSTKITVANPPQRSISELKVAPTIVEWFEMSAANNAHLIGNITLIIPAEDIKSLISRRSTFEFASDGGHDPSSGILTFGWVASIDRTIIAQARGPAQSHPLMAESFRAERYGIASAGQFARNLINEFQINVHEHEWIFYLDNKSMIQRLTGYAQLSTPKWNLRPDEDITRMAFHILNPIPHTLIHVKSHQDSAKDTLELPFPAILNVMADQQATRQRNLMTKPASMVQNLATAQLQINTICITRDSQKWLLYSAGKVPIQKFYSNKYGWTEMTFNNIAWNVQKSALQSFSIADQTRILKFVHGWLPTASRSFKEGTSTSQRCKICHAPREDNFHLFHCTNNEMATIQEKNTTVHCQRHA
jgi:hypothetical protein